MDTEEAECPTETATDGVTRMTIRAWMGKQ